MAILLRQRATTVTVGFFADPVFADHTPNAYASKLFDFYSSQFANVAAGRGLCNTWCAESVRTDEFVLVVWCIAGYGLSCSFIFLFRLHCRSECVFQFAVNTRSDSVVGVSLAVM